MPNTSIELELRRQDRAATATLTNVVDSNVSAQLLAANTARKGVIIENDSSAIMYVKYGTTASTTSFTVKIAANARWEMSRPIYLGRIDAVWASDSTGSARVTELT
jgi:inorganic triphosphatase YgiF